ncbi:hypothetical protein EUX98_g3272 [Antrodiella citrinella]|uniref:Enoyl reductase (ER) domain-containing protein n=1 Tax=Antrodiella citrinella TaxID=2447956 RepID=A0A4S4N526_9APHY|nr:hypothetical protein EUX98_g3272 [Antrodiella citrinella]
MSPIALPSQHAAVLHGPKDLRIEDRTLWPPSQGQLQVAVKATGLCGSDLHYYLHARNGDFAIRSPLVLGHEAAGVVTAIGPGVRGFYVGQRVAIEAGIMCNACDYCTSARYNLCKSMRFASSAKTFPHLDGTLQDRMNHPAHVVHPLPDGCSYEQASLAEPLSVLIHAARRVGLSPATPSTVLVFGSRLDFAVAQGFAQHAFCLPVDKEKKTTEEALRRAKENVGAALSAFEMPEGFDTVFECTGAEPCIQMSIHAAVTGGKVMLVGMGSRNVTLPLSAAATREVDIHGSFRYANTYPQALSLLASGQLPHIESIITHRFPLEKTAQAFEMLAKGRDAEGRMVIKIMVGPGC